MDGLGLRLGLGLGLPNICRFNMITMMKMITLTQTLNPLSILRVRFRVRFRVKVRVRIGF
jgi:hypothetical protein